MRPRDFKPPVFGFLCIPESAVLVHWIGQSDQSLLYDGSSTCPSPNPTGECQAQGYLGERRDMSMMRRPHQVSAKKPVAAGTTTPSPRFWIAAGLSMPFFSLPSRNY